MMGKTICFTQKQVLLLTFIGLMAYHTSFASGNTPVLSLGVMHCGQTYLVQLFDSGLVEYLGLRGVNVEGRQHAVINPLIVNNLLKQAEDGGFFLADDRLYLPNPNWNKFPHNAIRIQYGDKSAMLLNANSVLTMKKEVLRIKEISQWIGAEKECKFHIDALINNDLKLKN